MDGIFKTPKEVQEACDILQISKEQQNKEVLNRLTFKKPSISPSKKNITLKNIDRDEIQKDFNRSNDLLKSQG